MRDAQDAAPQPVTQGLAVELIGPEESLVIDAELRYHPADPYAVTVTFGTQDGGVAWRFGRDLLVDGLDEPTGLGDVHLRPCIDESGHAVVVFELFSRGVGALVQARAADLRRFVERSVAVLPQGVESEYVDVDAAVADLLVSNPHD